MNSTLINVLRVTAIGAGVVGAISGFVVDRNDSKDLDDKLQEMRDIEERIKKVNEE